MRKSARRIWLRSRGGRGAAQRKGWGVFSFLLSAVLGIGLALYVIARFDAGIRPILTDLALTKTKNTVTALVNDAVNRTVSEEAIAYGDIVTLQTDNSGRITALTSNSAEMNRLRGEIIADIVGQVDCLDTDELGVPLGNLTGLSSLSDKGPLLPVRVVAVGAADAQFENVFTEAGINQTYHKVMLNVSVAVKLLIPGGTVETTVTAQVNVAETVIVGQVPDAYLQFGNQTQ